MRVETVDLQISYPVGVTQPKKPCTFTSCLLPTYGTETEILRPAVIICPGGAYRWISDREGEPVAQVFLASGVSAFVLSYTCADNGRFPCALVETFEAVRYVRAHAEAYRIDPNRIFLCGFSAGGHAAASAGVFWNHPLARRLGYEGRTHRPDGLILGYPVISSGAYAHEESFRNLLGDAYSDELLNLTSLEKHVNPGTPRTFLWHTATDQTVPAQNSLLFAQALIQSGVETELHIYPRGVHGLSTARFDVLTGKRNSTDPFLLETVRSWTKDAVRFLFA